ncbi:mediator of RNA polymerase II transcription subunit 24 [Strigomonas culicis]|uniref:Mediator of RNA polymerase II transcription subunit 24 n=1 Tax=Strigomonas culicis TaxID=28005 RepID=S9TLW8_9TRYP|nr:mediator of RNA polymerase II transcription subunit 24 [Strigomonas culicis]|eukprot:EPY17799.1 mediator of RNA polymerase II transcription subunit 24 [Strigomonas culicis]
MLGKLTEARRYVAVLLRHDPASYLGLLLLALLHASEGRYDRAAVALAHLEARYAGDVPTAVVSAAVKAVSEREPALSGDAAPPSAAQEDLAVALARLHQCTGEVQELEHDADRKHTIKALAMQCVPGEESSAGMSVTAKERMHLVAGHWALLTHTAVRMQATAVFHTASEAALAYLQQVPHERRAFADVLCSRTRMSLIEVKARLPPSHCVRDLNLLGALHPAPNVFVERQQTLPLTSAVRGAETSDSTARAAVLSQPEVLLLRAQLTKALEAYSGHAEAFALLGALYLMDAGQRHMNAAERTVRLSEAAHYCTLSARCDIFQREALEGLGVVRELQGATQASVDLFSTASEMVMRESLLSFQRFAYLLY